MNCSTAREALWPPEKPRLADPDVLVSRQHVESCEACQDYFLQDRRLLDAYGTLRDERAPRRVREPVFDSLARERAGGLARESRAPGNGRAVPLSLPRWIVGAAASMVLLSALGTGAMWVNRAAGQPKEGELFVDDYLRRAVGQDNIVSTDEAEVARFLVRELGMPIVPMRLAGLELEGAEVCFLDGRRGAMIRYRQNGREVTHYVIPRDGVPERAPEPSRMLPGAFDGQAAPSVVTWATPSMEQALVGAVPAERLLVIAQQSSSL